jgi:hypothetical protein
MISSQITFVPSSLSICGYDAGWMVGPAEVALLGAAFRFVSGLIIAWSWIDSSRSGQG